MTQSQYLNSIKNGAIEGWHTYKILPSLTGAQAALESGWGTSTLSKPPYNNQFGIKASNDWTGRRVTMPTKEWNGTRFITVNAEFRAYDDKNDSVRDHAEFFTSTEWRKENYKYVVGERSYIKGAKALSNAGYATDPNYSTKLINIIEKYNLDSWDKEAFGMAPTPTLPSQPQPDLQPITKTVGGELSDAGRDYVRSQASVSVIGDSLGVGTKPYLQQLIPDSNYDVLGSRQITHTTPSLNGTLALTNMKNAGNLKQTVVVILGTNRGLTAAEIDDFMQICGPERKVLWVQTHSEVGHMFKVNAEIVHASKRHKNAYNLDWFTLSSPMFSEWYGDDRIHMTAVGYKKHAEYIAQAIYEMETGDLDSRSAQSTITEYYGLKGLKLYEDGRIEYEMHNPATGKKEIVVEETDIRGLSTDGVTNYIYNYASNEKWNPQNECQTAEWLDTKFENSDLKGVELLKAAASEMMLRGEPETKYRVKLSRLPQNIDIGSEGLFIDHESKPPLYVWGRVLEIVTSETNPEFNEVIIGNTVELEPQEKSLTHQMQQELIKKRNELFYEWRESEPVRVIIESTGSLIFSSDDSETQLIARVYHGNYDVTEQFNRFIWERVSEDDDADTDYNKVLQETEKKSTIIVRKNDVYGDESTFICRVFDDADSLMGSAGAVITLPDSFAGKSAYEIWLELGHEGTEEDFVESLRGKDGTDGIDGTDGSAQYLHIAWASNPMGKNFSTDYRGEHQYYMGSYVDEIKEDSADWTKYTWVRVKGADGQPGAPGAPGKPGVPGKDGLNLHIAWADDDKGTNFSTQSADGRTYIGYTTTESKTPPSSWRSYTWQKMAEVYADEFNDTIIEMGNILRITREESKAIATEIEQTRDSYLITHQQEIIQQIEYNASLSGKFDEDIRLLKEHRENVNTYFEFSDALRIGKSNSQMQITIDNQEMAFLDGGVKSAYLNANRFHAQNLVVEKSLTIGKNHQFETDGDLTIVRYIGG